MTILKRSNLRQLITVLALLGALVTVVNMYLTSSKVQKTALINGTLQSNEAYAAKLADSAQVFLESIRLEMAYSANAIAQHWHDSRFLKQEVARIAKQNQVFNAVVLVNTKGVIVESSDIAHVLVGSELTTEGTTSSLESKKAHISQPYQSALNHLVIMISHPIYAGNGAYLGFIGGTINLKEKNILQRLLGEHYYKDGSHIYVVDQNRRLLYHPEKNRIGSAVSTNPIIDKAIVGGNGSEQITNSQGVEMLSGYAHIPDTKWGVVSQRPLGLTLESHMGTMEKIIFSSLPINLAALALIWFCAWLISNPLRQLAANAKNMRALSTLQEVGRIKAWYFEANELKTAFLLGLHNMQEHVGQLNKDIRTDPLTGLLNRRALAHLMEHAEQLRAPFSAITLDIDHFKRVNDTYGHDVGDVVLKELATLMMSSSREEDACLRVGGEEFLIILPECPITIATEIAERLRLTVAAHHFPTVGKLTISLGVSHWPTHGDNVAEVLKRADIMMYEAKQNGRNQTRTAT